MEWTQTLYRGQCPIKWLAKTMYNPSVLDWTIWKKEYLLNYYSSKKWWILFNKYFIYHSFFLDHMYLSKQ